MNKIFNIPYFRLTKSDLKDIWNTSSPIYLKGRTSKCKKRKK